MVSQSNKPSLAKEKPRILIVDDEPDIVELLSWELTDSGYEVVSASNIRKAMEIIQSEPVDLVLSDIRMPYGSGVDLLRSSKQLRPELPVILMSGFSDYPDEELFRLGASKRISKPFDMDNLLNDVSSCLVS